MKANYQTRVLQMLRDELLSAPATDRLAGAARAETLLARLEDGGDSIERRHLFESIAGHAPEARMSGAIPAVAARREIPALIDELSSTVDMPVEAAGQRVFTIDELSRLFNVSTKTINRWRSEGLVGRRFLFAGRKRVGFLESSVEQFRRSHLDRVKRGSDFSQMSDTERHQVIERARILSQRGLDNASLLREIAAETGRSVETIRYTLKRFDREHPESPLLTVGQIESDAAREKIYSQFRRGASVSALARQFQLRENAVRSIVSRMRARRLMELPLDFMPSEEFKRRGAEKRIMSPPPEPIRAPRQVKRPSDLPAYLASLYEVPLLTPEEERHLFRKFNFLKYRASRLRDRLDVLQPDEAAMDRIESLYQQAVDVKNHIIRANLRLVVSIAKKYRDNHDRFFDLISDGNMSLIRAVEKFDYSLGNKFSTYASWAIKKNYMRAFSDDLRRQDRFRTGHDETLLSSEENRPDPGQQELDQQRRTSQIGHIMHELTDREQEVILRRFGLGEGREPLTLQQIGAEIGVSKERVRQIEARALEKLRHAAVREHIEDPTP